MACIGPFWGLSLRFFSSTIIPGLCDSACLGSFNLLKNTFPPIFARPKIRFEKKKKSTFFQKFPKTFKKFPSFFGRKNENSDASWQSSAASLTSTRRPQKFLRRVHEIFKKIRTRLKNLRGHRNRGGRFCNNNSTSIRTP